MTWITPPAPCRARQATLAARGESLAAFDGRCIPAGCVAPRCRVEDGRGHDRRGELLVRQLSQERRCLNPHHDAVSRLRSSNRTCGFPASGSPTGFTPRLTTEG